MNVPAVALTAGLVLFLATPWLRSQVPELPPVLPVPVEVPGDTSEIPPSALDPLPPLPQLPSSDSPPVTPKLPVTKLPPLTAPVPKTEPMTPTALPQLPPAVQPIQPLEPLQPLPPPRPPAFRLRSQQTQPSMTPLPPVAVIVERPPLLAGTAPGNLAVTPSLALEKKGAVAVQLNQPFPYEINSAQCGHGDGATGASGRSAAGRHPLPRRPTAREFAGRTVVVDH